MLPLNRTYLACATAIALFLPGLAKAESVEEALQRLLSINHALTAATHEVRAAHYEVDAADGAMEPQVSMQGKLGPEWYHTSNPDPDDKASQTHMTGSVSADVDYNLYDGDLRIARYDEADATLQISDFARQKQASTLMLDGVLAYMQVLTSEQLANLANKQYKLAGAQLRYESDRSAKGEGTAIEVNYANQRRQQIARRKNEADGQRRSALLAYANLFQITADMNKMTMPHLPREQLPKTLEQAREFARTDHPDLKSATSDVKRSVARARASEAASAPKLSLYGNLGHDANVSGTSDDETRAGAGVRLAWTLYDGNTNNALYLAAKEREQAARARAGDTHDQLMDNVDQLWVDWETAGERVKLAEAGLRSVKSLVGQRKRQMDEGKETEGTLIDARGQMAAAEFELASARAERDMTGFRLLAATGRLTPQSFGLTMPNADKEADAEKDAATSPSANGQSSSGKP